MPGEGGIEPEPSSFANGFDPFPKRNAGECEERDSDKHNEAHEEVSAVREPQESEPVESCEVDQDNS